MRTLLGLCLAVFFWITMLPSFPVWAQSDLAGGIAGSASSHSSVLLAATPLAAVPPTEILSRLFTESDLQVAWFAESFLAQISLGEISQIIQGIRTSLGDYQSIEDVDNGFVLTFEQGTVPAHLAVNAQGKITGLLFETPQMSARSLPEVITQFQALPGQVHMLVTRNGEPIAELNADEPLAVGSTFKLWILQALQPQIAAGQHQWDELVTLQDDFKSLPSGFLQTWPAGSQLTVQSLATLMISQSDNTATDHLLHLVGRDSVEALSERNRPFLSTREAFVLKDPANRSILRRWRKRREKQSLLSPIAALPLPDVSIFNDGPQSLDVEWFFTAQELCSAMEAVADLPLMSVNPGLVNPERWEKASFKGGSEPGVENLTTYLVEDGGDKLCVTATWNNEAGIDGIKFSTLYSSLIESSRSSSGTKESAKL